MSIQSFINYLQAERKYSLHTITAYRSDLQGFSDFCFRNFKHDDLSQLDYRAIRLWLVELVDEKISNRSINRKMSALKSYYNFLLKSKQIESHPMRTHKSLKTPKRISVPFNQSEMDLVIESLKEGEDFNSVRNRLMVELLYSTGIRRAELIELKEKDIDISNATIKVMGKRKKERYIPLLRNLKDSIENYQEIRKQIITESETFFVTESGKKLYPNLVYRLINDYFSKVSTKVKKSPHVIRHSFATHLLNEGADMNSVKELLGHSSLASTQVYTQNSLNDLKKMYNQAHPRSIKNQ